MPEDIEFDLTDKGTLCLNVELMRTKGDAFYLMKLAPFGWEIILLEHVSPNDPITLFIMYYTPEIIDMIVEKTNEYMQERPGNLKPHARAND
jgi:hypothetical protein